MNNANILKFVILFLTTCHLNSCKTQSGNSKPNIKRSECKIEGIVKDMRYLDGCKFLFLLPDGTKILPVGMPDNIPVLQDGMRVFIDFEKIDDGMSICMAESFMANITCLEADAQNGCIEINNLDEQNWARDLLPQLKPAQILKYSVENSWQYVFYGQSGNYLYDCVGNLICKTMEFKESNCFTHLHGEKGVMIWRSEEINR